MLTSVVIPEHKLRSAKWIIRIPRCNNAEAATLLTGYFIDSDPILYPADNWLRDHLLTASGACRCPDEVSAGLINDRLLAMGASRNTY